MRSLLICGAHPDDEAFFAGTMAKYVAEGARVSVLCGTRGERGSTADLCSIPELPKVREAELRDSMALLGLPKENVFFLPYEDQKLHLAPVEDVRRELVKLLRKLTPHVVVTFDPNGANGHSDHVAISRFVSDALPAAADARYGADLGKPWAVARLLWQPPQLPWRMAAGTKIRECFGTDFLIDTRAFAERKRAAVLAHKTQLPGLANLYQLEQPPGPSLNEEVFRLGAGSKPEEVPAGDLFVGIG